MWYNFYHGTGEAIESTFPFIRAIGGVANAFWMLLGLVGIVGWSWYESKHPDAPEKLD